MALVFEYRINKKRKGAGVKAMSIVESPAVEVNFLTLSKEEIPEVQLKVNKEQQIVTGPAMIPNIKIYRSAQSLGLDEDGYIYFTEDTIKKASELFLENELMNNATLEHDEKVDDLKLVESWIIIDKEKDKSVALGFELPVGTWMVSYKVNNKELWDRIKNGEFKGFSIEADNLERVQAFNNEVQFAEDGREIISDKMASMIIDHLKDKGQTIEELNAEGWYLVEDPEIKLGIDSTATQPSKLDRAKYQVRYAYKLKPDNIAEDFIIKNSRDFCKEVHSENKWYRLEDIEQATNPEFGDYNILKYAGSYNCRHYWDKNYFSKKMIFADEDPIPTEDEAIEMILSKLDDLK